VADLHFIVCGQFLTSKGEVDSFKKPKMVLLQEKQVHF